MAERTPTDVLMERARDDAEYLEPDMLDIAKNLTALADRLAELAALEPVLELLAVMDKDTWPALWVGNLGGGDFMASLRLERMREVHAKTADTPEDALAALAAAVREGGA